MPQLYKRLAAYEDAIPLERAQELAQAEKDGRLVVLSELREPLVWGDSTHDTILCPNCNHDLMGMLPEDEYCEKDMYQCPYCGQPIDIEKAMTREEAEAALKKGRRQTMRLIDADAFREHILGGKPIGLTICQYSESDILAMIREQPTITSLPNEPLTLEELREMDGEQVWIDQPDGSKDCSGWAMVELARPWRPGGPKPHVFVVSPNGDRDYAGLLLECGAKIYRRKPKEKIT